MQVEILGCSGGIGRGFRTTSMLVDEDILIDCGTGVGDLALERMNKIKHLFLTHSHLDHITFLPFLADTAFEALREKPLTIYLQVETLEVLKTHIFNWKVWPDFGVLPDADNPVLRYQIIRPGDVLDVDGRKIEAIAAAHTIPTLGYRVESSNGNAFAYTGDCCGNNTFWQALNAHSQLNYLFAECAFPDREKVLAKRAGHYSSSVLVKDLSKLQLHPKISITHMTPDMQTEIMGELTSQLPDYNLRGLKRGDIFTLK